MAGRTDLRGAGRDGLVHVAREHADAVRRWSLTVKAQGASEQLGGAQARWAVHAVGRGRGEGRAHVVGGCAGTVGGA